VVRRLRQIRLAGALFRPLRLFLHWILVWLNYLTRRLGRRVKMVGQMLGLLVRPKDPNNLFALTDANENASEGPVYGASIEGEKEATLLWAGAPDPHAGELKTGALSLWRGVKPASLAESAAGAEATNRRAAYIDLLASQIRKLSPQAIAELEGVVEKLARKWLDWDQAFEIRPRRNRLDVGKTLRYNIPRYGGQVLSFKWAEKDRPIPKLVKPARILVIGDVSHSMVPYVSVVLYFFHMLNFRFVVESFVFSEKATYSTPYLNGLGTFEEKVGRLTKAAESWNAGTKFGSSLADIAESAAVDEETYVIIATDGKVKLDGDETAKIEQYMGALRARAKQIIFLTPSAEFADGATGVTKPVAIGAFRYDFVEIPIYSVGPPLWYGTLGKYADRIYLVKTVQDLVDMAENLILQAESE
jgi:hypothetical protein